MVTAEAVADRFGGNHPVVCTSGWPAPVAADLLRALGAELRYHGDLDWAGVAICTWLVERCSVQPWRMSVEDYLAAPSGRPLQGLPRKTPWDPALAAAMAERGVVHEEHVLDGLLDPWPSGLMMTPQGHREGGVVDDGSLDLKPPRPRGPRRAVPGPGHARGVRRPRPAATGGRHGWAPRVAMRLAIA